MKNVRKLTDFQAQILPLLDCETPMEAEKKHPFFSRESLVRVVNMCPKMPTKASLAKLGNECGLAGRFQSLWLNNQQFKHRLYF